MNTTIATSLIEILNHETNIRISIKSEILNDFCFDESTLMIGDEIYLPLKEMIGEDALSAKYDNDGIELLVHASSFEREELEFNDIDIKSLCPNFDVSSTITLFCMTEVDLYDIRVLFLSDENGNLALLYVHEEVLKKNVIS